MCRATLIQLTEARVYNGREVKTMAEIYAYRVFTAVVENGSFTSAAQSLDITPSAVSHTISKLEKDIGFALFIRSRGKLELTHNGRVLLPRIYDLIKLQDRIMQEKQEILGVSKGSVRIGAFNSVTMKWIPQIIRSYREKYPGIDVQVYEGKYSDVVSGVSSGMFDMGFVTTTQELNSEIIALYDDPLVCVTPKDFVPKNPGRVTVEEISEQTILMQAEGLASDTEAFLAKNGIRTDYGIRVADDSSLTAMVASGFGISIMPMLLFKDEQVDVDLYEIDPPEYRTIGLLTAKEQFLSPAAKRMIEEIRNFAAGFEK